MLNSRVVKGMATFKSAAIRSKLSSASSLGASSMTETVRRGKKRRTSSESFRVTGAGGGAVALPEELFPLLLLLPLDAEEEDDDAMNAIADDPAVSTVGVAEEPLGSLLVLTPLGTEAVAEELDCCC